MNIKTMGGEKMTSYAKLTDTERRDYMLNSIKEQKKKIAEFKKCDEKDPSFRQLDKSKIGTFSVEMPILELHKIRV